MRFDSRRSMFRRWGDGTWKKPQSGIYAMEMIQL